MKRTLLSFCLIFSLSCFSQTVTNYNNAISADYIIVESTSAIDQSTTGTGLTWDFTTLTATGVSSDVHATPTASEATTYPGTNTVQTTTSGTAITKVFSKEISNEVSFTGAETTDSDFNYITDNALLGTFPLNYGYTNSDATAGNLTYPGLGTIPFTGSIDAEIDAYGTLNLNDVGLGAYSGTVTRLKITQNINFTVVIVFPFPGTATQTTYNYYENSTGNLVFRNTTLDINVPGLLSDSNTILEVLSTVTLSNKDNLIAENLLQIFPNPVDDILNIGLKKSTNIKSLTVIDVTGRTIIYSETNNVSLNVTNLPKGLYLLSIKTENGALTKKFIKK